MFMVATSTGRWVSRASMGLCDTRCRPARGSATEVTTMNRIGTLLSSAAVLALVCGVAGYATAGKPKKPGPTPVTQLCELSGDAEGEGEVGVNVTAYGDLAMTVGGGTNLAAVLPAGSYSGIGRVLKGRTDSRLDFAFNEDGFRCRLVESGDGPPPIYDSDLCRYRLILEFGLYDRKADLVSFELPTSRARLWDFQQELNEDGDLDPVGAGHVILDVRFE